MRSDFSLNNNCTYIHTVPIYCTNGSCGEREMDKKWSMVVPEKAALTTGVRTAGPPPADSR